jgi:hypothetical protein
VSILVLVMTWCPSVHRFQRFRSPLAFTPKHRTREPFARLERLGAAKKKKRARRTEGRTGLSVGAQRCEGERTALRHLAGCALRHGPVAVPPVEIYYTKSRINRRINHRFSSVSAVLR